jgi:hypothetical protein
MCIRCWHDSPSSSWRYVKCTWKLLSHLRHSRNLQHKTSSTVTSLGRDTKFHSHINNRSIYNLDNRLGLWVLYQTRADSSKSVDSSRWKVVCVPRGGVLSINMLSSPHNLLPLLSWKRINVGFVLVSSPCLKAAGSDIDCHRILPTSCGNRSGHLSRSHMHRLYCSDAQAALYTELKFNI